MPRKVLQTIHTAGTTPEIAYGLLMLGQRPEVLSHGATVQDAAGNPTDTLVLVENDDDGGNGSRQYAVRLAGPMDALSSAVVGDTV